MLRHSYSNSSEDSAYVFFFSGFGDRPDLHSFPTRRSSDLIAGDSLVLEPKLCSAGELRVFSLAADTPIPDPWSRVRRSLTDRKSTRLNSSHSQISYAVFCLKKKRTPLKKTTSATLSGAQ